MFDLYVILFQMARFENEASAREASYQNLFGELETANTKLCLMKERLAAAEQESARAVNESSKTKAEMDSRSRSYKNDLAESVSEIVSLRSEVEEKGGRVIALEAEVKQARSKMKEVQTQCERMESDHNERLTAWQEVQEPIFVA